MTREEHDKDMIESIEMWLHEIEPKWVEKELNWLEELRTRLLEESQIPNDLEEAAWDCVLDSVDVNNPVLLPKYKELLTYLFIAGAKWDRSQMMKEAMEGYVDKDFIVTEGPFYFFRSVNLDLPNGFKEGDKVRVIVLPKEDEK